MASPDRSRYTADDLDDDEGAYAYDDSYLQDEGQSFSVAGQSEWLRKREEELRKLNEEIEAKRKLVEKKTEAVLKPGPELLQRSPQRAVSAGSRRRTTGRAPSLEYQINRAALLRASVDGISSPGTAPAATEPSPAADVAPMALTGQSAAFAALQQAGDAFAPAAAERDTLGARRPPTAPAAASRTTVAPAFTAPQSPSAARSPGAAAGGWAETAVRLPSATARALFAAGSAAGAMPAVGAATAAPGAPLWLPSAAFAATAPCPAGSPSTGPSPASPGGAGALEPAGAAAAAAAAAAASSLSPSGRYSSAHTASVFPASNPAGAAAATPIASGAAGVSRPSPPSSDTWAPGSGGGATAAAAAAAVAAESSVPPTAEEEEDLAQQIRRLGPEGVLRFHRAKARVLQEQLTEALATVRMQESRISTIEAHERELLDEKNKLQRSIHTLEAQVERYKKQADDSVARMATLDAELVAAKKTIETLERAQKKEAAAMGAREIRLNRALEELERTKAQLKEAREGQRDVGEGVRREVEQLQSEKKRLERQKAELIGALRKQSKLIDVLRRQKIHLEAARLLSFTEDEFSKVIELGERL